MVVIQQTTPEKPSRPRIEQGDQGPPYVFLEAVGQQVVIRSTVRPQCVESHVGDKIEFHIWFPGLEAIEYPERNLHGSLPPIYQESRSDVGR